MRCGFAIVPVVFSIGLLSAQQSPLSGPFEAFTFDVPTGSLRPIIGFLGSASLGQPILGGLAFGSVAPRQSYALAFEEHRCVLVLGLGSDQTSTVDVSGSFTLPEGVAWSGDGSIAILYSRTGNWIQILSGLPSVVNPSPVLSLAAMKGSLSAIATDLHGAHIAIGIAGSGAGIYQVENGVNIVPLFTSFEPAALAFSDDGGTLYSLDRSSNKVWAQNMADLSSQSWSLDGLTDPVALRSTHDATQRDVVYVAGGTDQLLLAYDSSTHAVVASVPLSFQPNVIEPLGPHSFVLGSRSTSADTLWSFTNAPQPAVYFVPATPLNLREIRRK
jgi:hypothetical protein